jgi:hypothetical protein
MDTFEDILAAIHAGIPPKEIADQITWEDVSEEDREQLLIAARELGDDQAGYQLFLLLNALSQDEWFTLRVLGYAIQHPILILADRQNTLRTMRRILDKVRARIAAETQTQEKLGWERLFEAAYFVLSAEVCEEAGNVKEALRNYRQAQVIYQELGFNQPLHKIMSEIKRLQPVVAPAKAALPSAAQPFKPAAAPAPVAVKIAPVPAAPAPNIARTDHVPATPQPAALPPRVEPLPPVVSAPAASQQAETERLAAQIQAQNRALSDLQSRIRQLQEQRDRLGKEISAQEERLKASRQPAPAAPISSIPSIQNKAAPAPDQEQADQLTALSRQIRHLQEELRIEKENNQRLIAQNRQAVSQIKPAGTDSRPLPVQELEELRQKITDAQAEDEHLKEQIQQKQARLEKLEQLGQQKEALLQEIADLKRKVKDMLRDQENLSTQQDELEERRRKRASELEKLDSEIHARTIEKQKLEEQLQHGSRKKDN